MAHFLQLSGISELLNIVQSVTDLENIHLTPDMFHLLDPATAHLMIRQHLQGKILRGRLVQAEADTGKSS